MKLNIEFQIKTNLEKNNISGPKLNYKLRKERIPLTVGSCENGISDSIPILILENHRFQNFWKGTHVKIES